MRARGAAIALALLPWFTAVAAEDPAADVRREIDAQVWVPMLRASNAFDTDGFLAVLSPDLVRVSVDRNEVYGMERYASEIRAGFTRARERGLRRTSDMRFVTRAHSDALARDTGIFRSEAVMASGEKRVTYTAFEMLLRKEQGRWKLIVDQDTALSGVLTEQDYLAARPLSVPLTAPAPRSQ